MDGETENPKMTEFSKKVSEAYLKALQEDRIRIDLMGHWNRSYIKEWKDPNGYFHDHLEPQEFSIIGLWGLGDDTSHLERILTLLEDPNKEILLPNGTKFDQFYFEKDRQRCVKCGCQIDWRFDGKTRTISALMPAHEIIGAEVDLNQKTSKLPDGRIVPVFSELKEKCKYSRGFPSEIITYLEVPSGRLVFGEGVRRSFPTKEVFGEEEFDYKFNANSYEGKKNIIEQFARFGLCTGWTGSFGAEVFKKDDEIKLVWNSDVVKNMEYLGKANIDQWWYSCADYDLLKKRDPDALNDMKSYDGFIANVHPGRYKITNLSHLPKSERREIIARIIPERQSEDIKNPYLFSRM